MADVVSSRSFCVFVHTGAVVEWGVGGCGVAATFTQHRMLQPNSARRPCEEVNMEHASCPTAGTVTGAGSCASP
jgi:hypothetical protein